MQVTKLTAEPLPFEMAQCLLYATVTRRPQMLKRRMMILGIAVAMFSVFPSVTHAETWTATSARGSSPRGGTSSTAPARSPTYYGPPPAGLEDVDSSFRVDRTIFDQVSER